MCRRPGDETGGKVIKSWLTSDKAAPGARAGGFPPAPGTPPDDPWRSPGRAGISPHGPGISPADAGNPTRRAGRSTDGAGNSPDKAWAPTDHAGNFPDGSGRPTEAAGRSAPDAGASTHPAGNRPARPGGARRAKATRRHRPKGFPEGSGGLGGAGEKASRRQGKGWQGMAKGRKRALVGERGQTNCSGTTGQARFELSGTLTNV